MVEIPSELMMGIFSALFTAIAAMFITLKKQGNKLSQCLEEKATFEERCKHLEEDVRFLTHKVELMEAELDKAKEEIKRLERVKANARKKSA